MNFNSTSENIQSLSRQRTLSSEIQQYSNFQAERDSGYKGYSGMESSSHSKQSSTDAPTLVKESTGHNGTQSRMGVDDISSYNPNYSIGITSDGNYHEEYPFQDPINQSKNCLNTDEYFRENSSLVMYNNTEPKILPKNFEPYAHFETEDSGRSIETALAKAYNNDTTKQKRTPRPPNAFIIYRKETQANVIKSNPGVSNKEISVIIGKMWKQEPQSVKDQYKVKAENEKQIHKKMFPDYKYQPRKSKKALKADSNTPFSAKNIFANNSKSLIMNNAVNSGYAANSQIVYDMQNMPQSNLLYSSSNSNIKNFMNAETSKTLKPFPFTNQSLPSQFAQPISALPSNYGYNSQNANYAGSYGLPMNDVDAFQQRAILSPTSNKSIPNLSSYNPLEHDLSLKRISSTSDAFMNPMFSKQMDKLSRIYNENENFVNFNIQNLGNNPQNKMLAHQQMYNNSNNSNSKFDFFEKNNSSFNRLPETNAFNINNNLANKFDNINFFRNGASTFNNDPVYTQKGYELLEDVEFTRNPEQRIHYQQNDGFSVPLVVTDIHGNEL